VLILHRRRLRVRITVRVRAMRALRRARAIDPRLVRVVVARASSAITARAHGDCVSIASRLRLDSVAPARRRARASAIER
jgi:hypothetical protein